MRKRLHLSSKHRAMIETLLREHLPSVEVWAYGSRVNGRGHDGSDLDLVLRGPGLREIPAGQVRNFEVAIRDSAVPFMVEVRDWARLNEPFGREVERGYVVLVGGNRGTESEQLFGSLPEDWEYTTLGAACDRGGGDIQTGPFGSQLHASDYVPVGIPSIMPQNIGDNRINVDGIARISAGDASRLSRYLVREGDIVFSRRGDVERRALVRSAEDGWLCGTGCLRVRLGKHGADSRYASYFLGHPSVREWLVRHAHGATMPNLNTSILSACPFVIPPKEEQHTIAHILGTLDDKIELNRRMNETLEAMARALFKSWFIDFDPVRAKAALRTHAAQRTPGPITPPLRGSRGGEGASPKSSRWGDSSATQPPRPWPEIKRQYTSTALHHAQAMRQNQTNAEGLLWYYLQKKQLGGYKFRRQQPIGAYIADFACLPEKLLIELDGGQHADPDAPDVQRDHFLRQQGYRVLRFWNHDVFDDCFGVLERVYEALTGPPPPQPAPDGLASATPPQGGSDWSVERARAYLSGMDPAIAALFPDHFVHSELGEIPVAWEIGNLGYVAENPRRAVQPSDIDMVTPYIALEHMPKRCVGLSEWSSAVGVGSNKYAFRRGEFLFGKLRPYFHKVGIAPASGICSTDISVIAPRAYIWSSFVLLCISSSEFVAYTDQTSTGTKMPRTSWNIMREFKVCLPTRSVTALFQKIAQPVLDRIVANCQESRALAALRETLIPKLIAGNLRLKERL